MNKRKKYYYVQVIARNKPKFVTGNNYQTRISEWQDNEKPYEFSSKILANDIAMGLCLNGFYAYVIESFYKLEFTNKDLES